MTPEAGALKIARILTGNPSLEWDWNEGKPIMTEEQKPYGSKTCSACGEEKPLSEFFRDKKSRDGHASKCKVCASAIKKPRKHEPTGRYKFSEAASKGEWFCGECGRTVSLIDAHEYFHRASDTPSGFAYKCKPCKTAIQQEYRASKQGKPVPEKKANQESPPKMVIEKKPDSGAIVIHMAHRADLLKVLEQAASDQERTLEGQIIWTLKQALEAKGD